MNAGRFLSPKTPRGPLSWSLLAAIDLLAFVVLCLVWAIAESQWGQWIVIVLALGVWNALVIQSGKRRGQGVADSRGSVAAPALLLLLGLVALLAGFTALDSALQGSALYPGREAIGFLVISLPLMAYANLYFKSSGTEEA